MEIAIRGRGRGRGRGIKEGMKTKFGVKSGVKTEVLGIWVNIKDGMMREKRQGFKNNFIRGQKL